MTTLPHTLSEGFDPGILCALEGLDFKARYVMEGFLSGLHRSPFHGVSFDFSDYHRYQPGDDLRRLDWRLYARNDRLCIKRYLQETNVRFYLVCDSSASMAYRGQSAWASKLECSKVFAAAVAWFLLKQNDAGGLISFNGEDSVPAFVRPSQKPAQLGLLLRRLEALHATGGECLSALLEHTCRLARRRSVILFFSDLLEPAEEVRRGFQRLRFQGHEVVIFQVLDRDEVEFPFAGPKVFVDLETGLRRTIIPAAARQVYLTRFNQFMEAYRDLFQELEMSHFLVRTDMNPCNALALFLSRRKHSHSP
jgi:uncharacterized protein (DUF58 family)